MQKFQDFPILADVNISCVKPRRRVSVESEKIWKNRRKRRWIFWLLFGEKGVDCGGGKEKQPTARIQ